MDESRKKADWPIIAALALPAFLIVAFGLYVGGYFAMGVVGRGDMYPDDGPTTIRYFDATWKAVIYGPAGKVEESLAGSRVLIVGPTGLRP